MEQQQQINIEQVIVNTNDSDYFWIDNALAPFFTDNKTDGIQRLFRFTAIVDIVSNRTV